VLPPAGRSVSIGRQRHVGSQQTCLSVRLIMPRRRRSDFFGGVTKWVITQVTKRIGWRSEYTPAIRYAVRHPGDEVSGWRSEWKSSSTVQDILPNKHSGMSSLILLYCLGFCHAMLCVVMQCLSVCVCVSATFVNSVKTNKKYHQNFCTIE